MKKVSNILSRKEWAGISSIVAIIGVVTAILLSSSNDAPPIQNEITPIHSGIIEKSSSSLSSIANAINKSPQDNLDRIYEGLLLLLENANLDNKLINIIQNNREPLTARKLGEILVISTVEQYKRNGFILFFDYKTETLISSSYDFQLGIKAIKYFETKEKSPTHLVSVRYITQSGTGLYCESVRIYSVEQHSITTALDKPYMEYIDGSWGAYKSSVQFYQNNLLTMSSGYPRITTIGQISYKRPDGRKVKLELPSEEYVWDFNKLIFRQVSGRQVESKGTMSEIYADYAEPNGDWFKKSDEKFIQEKW